MKKKILAITGIRSEYDILKPVLRLINRSKKLELNLIVSGCHLTDFHNFSFKLIKKDKFKILEKIYSLKNNNFKDENRSTAVSVLVARLSILVKKYKPDCIVVVGDREEAIASSIVGNYCKVVVAHIAGGDKAYGNADDPIRFATSKLSNIHFVFSKQNKNNLIKFGEDSFRIFNTGNPSLSNIEKTKKISLKVISQKLKSKLQKKNYIILIQHPISSESQKTRQHFTNSLNALLRFSERKDNFKIVCIKPNVDPGSQEIVKIYEKNKKHKNLLICNNLETDIFVNLVSNSFCIAGNSSMGLLESAFYNLFALNIGNRQKGRINPGNVIFVKNNVNSILKGLKKIQKYHELKKKINTNFYGDKKSAKRIVGILEKINFKNQKWLNKKKLCN